MALLEKWTPLRDMELMEQRMRRMFPSLTVTTSVVPAADIYETGGEIVVELEVPGYERKELEIEVSDHTLTVSGQRAKETEKTEKTLLTHERLESMFERSFQLPSEADTGHLKATYGTGVLTLHIPKTSQQPPLKIPIEAV